MRSRAIERQISGVATSDGARRQAHARDRTEPAAPARSLPDARRLSAAKKRMTTSAAFPDHPHRGFETVTYMLAGRMRHRDSRGNEGLLQAGGAQWMSAGPRPDPLRDARAERRPDGGLSALAEPAGGRKDERSLVSGISKPEEIPEFVTDSGVRVRVIAGASHGVAGAIARPNHGTDLPRSAASGRQSLRTESACRAQRFS